MNSENGEREPKEEERIRKVEIPERKISYRDWFETISKNFPDLVFPAELAMSMMAQVLIKDITNPFALVFIGVPASGKTITINFFAGIDGFTYASDKFTPSSFVSNAANRTIEQLKTIDLLPRIRYKMFLIRDLATVFAKGDDDLNDSLGLLTRVLDGQGLSTDSGTHGGRQYAGEYLFMFLAASTPIRPKVWKMMGNIGSRLFFYHMKNKEKSEDELVEQLTDLSYQFKEKDCQQITKQFIQTLWSELPEGVDWEKRKDPREYLLIIARCANLLARLRGVINVWKADSQDQISERYLHTVPVIENPDRINQLFYNLTRGHALIRGRKNIEAEDLSPIFELMLDSAPLMRPKLLRKLMECGGKMTTSHVMTELKCSQTTANTEMETLILLGICSVSQNPTGQAGRPEKTISLLDEWNWFISEEYKKLSRKADITPSNLPS